MIKKHVFVVMGGTILKTVVNIMKYALVHVIVVTDLNQMNVMNVQNMPREIKLLVYVNVKTTGVEIDVPSSIKKFVTLPVQHVMAQVYMTV